MKPETMTVLSQPSTRPPGSSASAPGWVQVNEARYNSEGNPLCDRCPTVAHWSICDLEISYSPTADDVVKPVVRWFACGRHLHGVLHDANWAMDVVHIYDLTAPEASS